MTNALSPGLSAVAPRARTSRLDVGVMALLLPVPVGLCVGIVSLMMGAHPVYVSFQMLLFILLVPLFYLIRTDDKYVAGIILASSLKGFFISQFICIFVWHAPDSSMLNPELTELGIAAGLAASMVGVVAARVMFGAIPIRKPILSWEGTPDDLRRMGNLTAMIGLPAQILWTIRVTHLTAAQHGGIDVQSSGAPIIGFLAPLALVSICCFSAEQLLRTDRRSFLSYRSIGTMLVYFAAILPLATKAEPLKPLVAIFVLVLLYRWRPQPVPILGGLALFVVVMEVFYPAITLTRMTAFTEQRPIPVVFGEIALKTITDPAELVYVRDFSNNFEADIQQNYFGRPLGFWDRFTPEETDRLIAGSKYLEPAGLGVFRDALYETLPQSLGFEKSLDSQVRLEIALTRKTQGRGQVSWANSGYVGDGFVAGGVGMVIVFCVIFGFGTSLVSRIVFEFKQKNVLWIPLLVIEMFTLSDVGFVSGTFVYFWSSAIYIGSVFLLLRYLQRGRRAIA